LQTINNKILLIEDDKESVFLISKLLTRLGYKEENIIACHSLQESYSIDDDEIEIILCDLTLPDSGADNTFERVYANFPHRPIIVLTGKDEHDFAVKTINQGAQDYLVKGSFGQDLLQKSIEYAIERKKTLNELERSRADYRRVFEESPNPMFVFDRNSHMILEVNIAAIRQYGYRKEEIVGKDMEQMFPADERKRFKEMLSTLTDRYTDTGNWVQKDKEGEPRHVQVYCHNTRFYEIDAVVFMAINIDEKVKVKERLKERNKEITDILDSISDGFYTFDKEFTITYANAAFEQIFNRKREETVGKKMWECFPMFKDSELHNQIEEIMDSKKTYHETLFSPTAQKWLSLSAYPVKDGVAIYLMDVTEEYQLKERLLNNDKTLRAIINNTNDIIWSIDKDLRIIEANDAFWNKLKDITGKERESVELEDFSREMLAVWTDHFARAFKGESFKEIWNEEKSGAARYQEISFNPIYDVGDTITGISCFSRDITAEKVYQHRIEEQNERLKEISWLQSHKVRSHVATILGLSQFVNKHIVTDPDLNEVLTGIKEAAKELDGVIKQINSLTKSVSADRS
jgi:PAS domain S-box-containing protein